MMEKRNLVERDRTPKLNRQEEMDLTEKRAVALFDSKPVKSGKDCPDKDMPSKR